MKHGSIVSIKSWRCGRHENSGIPGHRIDFNRHIKLSSSPPGPWFNLHRQEELYQSGIELV
jgi:hypothetical protein